jgi:hypothetical protein
VTAQRLRLGLRKYPSGTPSGRSGQATRASRALPQGVLERPGSRLCALPVYSARHGGVAVRAAEGYLRASASSTVHSGVVALMIPAVEEFTVCSATANSKYGTALANSAATTMCAHSRPWRGIFSCRASTMANSTAAPRASRAKVTSTGEKPRSASLTHKNADSQIRASDRATPAVHSAELKELRRRGYLRSGRRALMPGWPRPAATRGFS